MVEDTEFYLPDDDCSAGGTCPGEGVLVPQKLGNTNIDALFVGSEADTKADLDLANIDSFPLTDEVFPVIYDGAPLTLDGLMDCFARTYPERAQLLCALIEQEGYDVVFEENQTAVEAELEQHIEGYNAIVRRVRSNVATNADYEELRAMEMHSAELTRTLNEKRHWHIAPGRIYLSSRINRNIDKFNWFGSEDADLIDTFPTNAEGAAWLNAVMGDWMVRSGIPGATDDEEFSDSYSSRIIWGSVNVVFGAAEIVGGIVLIPATLGWGTVAGGAMTLAGFDAITQGFEMWGTPVESSHATGWLGDGAFAMMSEFGVLEEDDQTAFNKYWSFSMLGLSLGGAGILGFAGDAMQAQRAARLGNALDFVKAAPARGLASARMAIVAVKNAKFGKFVVSYAPLPSGRIVMNIKDVGRMVAPMWESLPRLRLRMLTGKVEVVQERAIKLLAGEVGLIALRGGVSTLADAKNLVYQVAAHMGINENRVNRLVSSIEMGVPGEKSAFGPTLRLKVAIDTGYARWVKEIIKRKPMVEYNEFIAMNEIFHELVHALRYQDWVKSGKPVANYWSRKGSHAYNVEELIVETTAREWTERIARPRVEQELIYGSGTNARHLQNLLNEALEDSDVYIQHYKRLTSQ